MSLWTDIAVTSGASATSLGLTGTGVYKLIRHFLAAAVDEQLDKKLDDKLTPIVTGIKERFDANDKATEAAVTAISEVRTEQSAVALNLATQFGGNGNGIRQALNELSVQVVTVKGAFEQHVQETKETK
jgi:hypothetical protein